MLRNILKIAIVQENRVPYDCKFNTEKGLLAVRKAKELGADIVLFPECWITGYEFPNIDTTLSLNEIEKLPLFREWNKLALDDDSEYILEFCNAAKELNIGIVITGYTKGVSRPRNSAFVIDSNGEILTKYSKVHTCDFADERLLECGNEFKVCDFNGIKIGIMICYDREYPESARVLMMKGAELILVPNDCGAMRPRVQALSTRAYENMVGVIMANPPGENKGCSCAFSPIVWDKNGLPVDNTIFLADDKTEGIYIAEYDIDTIRDYRSREMMGNTFRKVKAYSELLNYEIREPFIRR
jgi:predicted amidohydrolase